MSKTISKRTQRKYRPILDFLEDRCLLASWPVDLAPGELPHLLQTYGQYQEFQRRRDATGVLYDNDIILHEGIDILPSQILPPVARGNVYPVMDGFVEALWRANDNSAFVVVRDGTPQQPGELGWNYKHVRPDDGLQRGQPVISQGVNRTRLGSIAPWDSLNLPAHVHLDRGRAYPVNPERPSSMRDPGIRNRFDYRDNPRGERANAMRWQYAPEFNPLYDLADAVPDEVPPWVLGLKIRDAADDRLGTTFDFGHPANGPWEQPAELPRDASEYYYYGTIGKASWHTFTTALGSTTRSGTANVDLIASAVDRIGTSQAAGQEWLNPFALDLSIRGETFETRTRHVPSFIFATAAPFDSVQVTTARRRPS